MPEGMAMGTIYNFVNMLSTPPGRANQNPSGPIDQKDPVWNVHLFNTLCSAQSAGAISVTTMNNIAMQHIPSVGPQRRGEIAVFRPSQNIHPAPLPPGRIPNPIILGRSSFSTRSTGQNGRTNDSSLTTSPQGSTVEDNGTHPGLMMSLKGSAKWRPYIEGFPFYSLETARQSVDAYNNLGYCPAGGSLKVTKTQYPRNSNQYETNREHMTIEYHCSCGKTRSQVRKEKEESTSVRSRDARMFRIRIHRHTVLNGTTTIYVWERPQEPLENLHAGESAEKTIPFAELNPRALSANGNITVNGPRRQDRLALKNALREGTSKQSMQEIVTGYIDKNMKDPYIASAGRLAAKQALLRVGYNLSLIHI